MRIEINNTMSLDEIELTLNKSSDEEITKFIRDGWSFDGSLDGSPSPSARGYFDGTGDLAWTKDEYIVIDMYTSLRKDLVCRGFYSDTALDDCECGSLTGSGHGYYCDDCGQEFDDHFEEINR